MESSPTVIFLHGIGATPDSWDAQVDALPDGFSGVAQQLPGLHDDTQPFSLVTAARAVRDDMDRRGVEHAHVCGLSLGGMVAIRFAIDYPDRTATLVVSGAQVRPNPALMRVQNAVMRVLPEKLVAPPEMTKRRMLAVLREIAVTDLRAELPQIAAPTLVLCGLKDPANLPAARQIAAGIAGAELQLVPGAGHEWNVQLPDEFSARLNDFHRRASAA